MIVDNTTIPWSAAKEAVSEYGAAVLPTFKLPIEYLGLGTYMYASSPEGDVNVPHGLGVEP